MSIFAFDKPKGMTQDAPEWEKCPVATASRLSYWHDPVGGSLHITGPRGSLSLPAVYGKQFGEWLASEVWKPKHPVRDALEKRDAILDARYSERPTLAARMAADPTQDWT